MIIYQTCGFGLVCPLIHAAITAAQLIATHIHVSSASDTTTDCILLRSLPAVHFWDNLLASYNVSQQHEVWNTASSATKKSRRRQTKAFADKVVHSFQQKAGVNSHACARCMRFLCTYATAVLPPTASYMALKPAPFEGRICT